MVSYSPDLMWIPYQYFFDPVADPAVVQAAVEAAVNNYIAQISGVRVPGDFNGVFDTMQLDAVILGVPQVTDLIQGNIQSRYGSLPFASVGRKVSLNAGYCIIDPAYPLSATIIGTPDV